MPQAKTQTATERGLAILAEYSTRIEQLYPTVDGADEVEPVKLTFKLCRLALQSRSPGKWDLSCDLLQHFKTGRRLADRLFAELLEMEHESFPADWQPRSPAQNEQQSLASLLYWIIAQFDLDIWRVEDKFPELKPYWDWERARYFKMKTEAEEAERLD